MGSADSRLAAISKDGLGLVDGSEKRLMTVLPRSVGTFLISRPDISLNESRVSRIVVISSTDRSRMPSRSFLLNATLNFVNPYYRPRTIQPSQSKPVLPGSGNLHLSHPSSSAFTPVPPIRPVLPRRILTASP